jgi:hypothetical protein
LFSGLFQLGNLATIRLWLFLYLVVCVGSHMAPSRDDYRGALKGGLLFAALLLATAIVAALFGHGPAEVALHGRAILVPLVTIMLATTVLVALGTAAVWLLTDIVDRVRARR